jgi:hypothetical protein
VAQIHDDIKKTLTENGVDWTKNVKLAQEIKNLIVRYSPIEEATKVMKGNIFTKEVMLKGCKCPVCNQNVRLQKYTINAEMAKCLIDLYKLNKKNPEKIWFHVATDIKIGISVSGAFAKLRHWGLIEQLPKDNSQVHKRTSGMWRITDRGIDFVLNRIDVPKFIKVYNQTFYGFDEQKNEKNKPITVTDAIASKFNYAELLKNYE